MVDKSSQPGRSKVSCVSSFKLYKVCSYLGLLKPIQKVLHIFVIYFNVGSIRRVVPNLIDAF